ncbi:MAG: BamA/TamA family outer membrane protein [candidate division Zixibacteria bacterium]|nr:BamA/TamA family outer membrane protein [candidate division Zixibacteria bacterium]
MLKEKSLIMIVLTVLAVIFICGETLRGYEEENQPTNRLIIDYHKDEISMILDYQGRREQIDFYCDEVVRQEGQISIGDRLIFSTEGIVWGDRKINYDLLKRHETEMISRGHVKLSYIIRAEPPNFRVPRNLLKTFATMVIDERQFVRGDALVVGGDAEVYGEVSKNMISFFGDVTLHPQAVVRGHVITICGKVFRHDNSQVYGQIVSDEGWQEGGRKFGSRRGYYDQFELKLSLDYNRVDGLEIYPYFEYEDPDEIFPKISVGAGYAFEAERLHYHLDIAQKIFDSYAIEPYGRLYRETATEDDWIVSKNENLVYTLLVHEDFRDYYEKEGGTIGLKLYLGEYNSFDISYSYDDLDWMDSHPKLWSMFGSKEFRGNFSTLPYDMKQTYRDDFDSKLSKINVSYTFDKRSQYRTLQIGWLGQVKYEKAGDGLEGDLSYTRWIVDLTRYQPFNRYLAINARVMYGNSDQRLPLFKKFFLGGLNTLRGYDHKVFYGEQMALANIEYLLKFNQTVTGLLFFDIGKVVGQDDAIFSDGEFKSDIGLAVKLGPGLRLELARALDDSDADIKFWLTFSGAF